jgi:RND family efflux transporter MFP subunit
MKFLKSFPINRWTALCLGTVVMGVIGYWTMNRSGQPNRDQLVTYQTSLSELPITIVERGNLQSQTTIDIHCEVDDVTRDGINGTPIVWIVPNGKQVSKGELLVELDSSPIREKLDEQILDTEQAKSEKIQADASYDNQIIQNETSKSQAELDVELATLELAMFTDEDSGTHKLAVEEIKRTIDDTNSEIMSSEVSLRLKKTDRNGIESLFRLGYAGKSELDRSNLTYLQAESQYAAKLNRMETARAKLEKAENYEYRMQVMKLEGSLDSAKQNLAQILRVNVAKLAQARAMMLAREESLKKEFERLARYETQFENCKIYAPQDGMVAYANERDEEIREGTAVRMRQQLLSLPNLTEMQVLTSVHESVLDRIEPGQSATITVDAFPDLEFDAIVESVAVLPKQTRWYGSDTKKYETIVRINDRVERLKPGMTAMVEVKIDRLESVVTVPLQAVDHQDGKNWVYVENQSAIERRSVDLGQSNDRFVHVKTGLGIGESIVLNPSEVMSEFDNDLENAFDVPSAIEQPSIDETKVASGTVETVAQG